ncbi:MAG: TIGR04283 family arsenosugar biosynthesis glycosyltransferase [Opitutaceae bacterium]|nr:TIGR04283 family arsenosugar biosynthesis glycosyltransferase [Verrucomicrobiales bacterium]
MSEPATKTPPPFKFPWKRLVGVGVTGIALWQVFRNVKFGELLTVFGQTRWSWFFFALLLFGLACLSAGWRWHLMLQLTRSAVHLGASLRLLFIGYAFNFILLGPTFGDLAKSALYCRWFRKPFPEVIATAPLDRLLGLGGVFILGAAAFGVAAFNGLFDANSPIHLTVPPHLIIGGLACGVIGLIVVWRFRPTGNSGPVRFFNAFAHGVRQLLVSPPTAGLGLFLGVVVQLVSCLVQALCLKAVVTVDCPWSQLLWTFPVIAVLNAMPSVGGLGLREGAAAVLLPLYGIPKADAVAAALLYFPINLFWVAIGVGTLWREERFLKAHARAIGELSKPATITVIIPTLNEELELPETLRRLQKIPEVTEIIVVDGGSTDATCILATNAGCHVIRAERSRGSQLRAGAEIAVGDVVLMVHADTWLPVESGRAIFDALQDPSIVGGGCWKQFRGGRSLWMFGSRFKCATRLFLFGRIAADQAIFVRRHVLQKIGGIPQVPLMEEFELCRKMRKEGRLALADATVKTSARLFHRLGPLRTYLRMWRVVVAYYTGASPEKLQKIYEAR